MRKLLLSILIISCFRAPARQVASRPDSSSTEMWFNAQYFVVPADCEFAEIRRVGKFDKEKKVFDGAFTDYDKAGKIKLTGAYSGGKKTGTFKSYFSNHYLEWEGQFVDDRPEGFWYFYYSDGRPLSIFKIDSTSQKIVDHWNIADQQTVSRGEGVFSIEVPVFGFVKDGYSARIYSGKVKDGMPLGEWKIENSYSNGKELVATQRFENGKPVAYFAKTADPGALRIVYTPPLVFTNAENLLTKPCLVDEQLNFSSYFADILNARLALYVKGLVPGHYEYFIDVLPNGMPRNVRMSRPMETNTEKIIAGFIRTVNYWIPSQKLGKPITDTLTLRLDLNGDGSLKFSRPEIIRKNGS